MKLVVLTDRYPPFHEGGYELSCQQVTDGLRARGHDCVVLTSTFGLRAGVRAQRREDHVHRLLQVHSLHDKQGIRRRLEQSTMPVKAVRNYRTTKRFLQATQPDLVFVWHMKSTSVLPILAAQDLDLRTVFRIGSHWLVDQRAGFVHESSRLRRWYRTALMGFRPFEHLQFAQGIFISPSLKQAYQQAGFAVDPWAVIFNGIPEAWIGSEPPRCRASVGPTLRLVYAGRLEFAKGPHIAIQALKHLLQKKLPYRITLDIIGQGDADYVTALQQLVRAYDLQDVVHFLGALPRQELIERYVQYDMLLFTTLQWEGLGTTVIEAMAQGLIVIASDIGGPRDVIDHGQNGFLVPANQPEALAQMIERVRATPERMMHVGQAAIQAVRAKYTFARTLDQYETFLQAYIGS